MARKGAPKAIDYKSRLLKLLYERFAYSKNFVNVPRLIYLESVVRLVKNVESTNSAEMQYFNYYK